MKHAYIILAHQLPEHVIRLVTRLATKDSFIFIHVDKNYENVYLEIKNNLRNYKNVFFIKRYYCSWGGFEIVRATIEALRTVTKEVTDFQYVSLLSGQDYPIKSNKQIDSFLIRNLGKNFIQFFELPYEGWKDGGINRITDYFFGNRRNPNFISTRKMLFLNYLSKKIGLYKKKIPLGMLPYGGAQWWTFNKDAVNYVLDFVKKYPSYLRFFSTSLVPDEMFFQTILLNAPLFGQQLNIENFNLREIDYCSNSEPYPVTYSLEHFQFLKVSDNLFARKFEPIISSVLLDRIDQEILNLK